VTLVEQETEKFELASKSRAPHSKESGKAGGPVCEDVQQEIRVNAHETRDRLSSSISSIFQRKFTI